eukprot:952213-Rhodomonas_salina.1
MYRTYSHVCIFLIFCTRYYVASAATLKVDCSITAKLQCSFTKSQSYIDALAAKDCDKISSLALDYVDCYADFGCCGEIPAIPVAAITAVCDGWTAPSCKDTCNATVAAS